LDTPIYNTIMAVSAGLALLLLVGMGWQIGQGRWIVREGWAAAFIALGVVLTFTGGVMTVTWPLAPPLQFDNIIFGEPSLAFGLMLLVGGYLLGSRRFWPAEADASGRGSVTGVTSVELVRESWSRLATLVQPLSWFAGAMGLGLFGIAAAGIRYELFAAPPTEPISGEFADYPLVEAAFISSLYALIGIGAVVLPFALGSGREIRHGLLWRVIGVCWTVAGLAWLLFGALNYFTHIGLLVNENNAAL
jgi:uncharacterized membrane protein